MCSPALVILRGSDSALVAALMIQDLASVKTYENYEILWILKKDCYVNEQKISFFVAFFFLLLWASIHTHTQKKQQLMITFLLQ